MWLMRLLHMHAQHAVPAWSRMLHSQKRVKLAQHEWWQSLAVEQRGRDEQCRVGPKPYVCTHAHPKPQTAAKARTHARRKVCTYRAPAGMRRCNGKLRMHSYKKLSSWATALYERITWNAHDENRCSLR